MNKLQRGLRAISDERMDDTAVEMDACEQARVALDITRRALQAGCDIDAIIRAQQAGIRAAGVPVAVGR